MSKMDKANVIVGTFYLVEIMIMTLVASTVLRAVA